MPNHETHKTLHHSIMPTRSAHVFGPRNTPLINLPELLLCHTNNINYVSNIEYVREAVTQFCFNVYDILLILLKSTTFEIWMSFVSVLNNNKIVVVIFENQKFYQRSKSDFSANNSISNSMWRHSSANTVCLKTNSLFPNCVIAMDRTMPSLSSKYTATFHGVKWRLFDINNYCLIFILPFIYECVYKLSVCRDMRQI